MKYTINNTDYSDFSTIELNKLHGRTYFIPYPDRNSACAVEPKEKRYKSEKVICLNGSWDFKFFRSLQSSRQFSTRTALSLTRSTCRQAGSSEATISRSM